MTDWTSDTHKRWDLKLTLNRDMSHPGYRDDWYAEQCGGCKHYYPLTGPLGSDWGACTNPNSPLDGQLRFEHHGCDHFERDTTGRAPFQ
jgi:hypothetical protein